MDHGAVCYRRFLDGEESAFDEIIREYREGLTFFIDRYVHDASAAEDLAIDAFMELIVHKRRYNFKTKLKTYLFMIGRCRAIDYLKHNGRVIPMAPEETEGGPSPEEEFFADERKRILHGAMETLPEEMRAVLHLVYFEELSYEETARVMKKNRKQVDNLIYRAKAELRTKLGKEGELLI